MIRVFIAASSPVARAGLQALLRDDERFDVSGSAARLPAAADFQPDVIVLEWDRADDEPLPEMTAPAVVLTDDQDPDWVRAALRLGARSVLPRGASREEISAAIEAAAAGLVALEPRSVDAFMTAAPRTLSPEAGEALTPREIEVLGMLAEGEGNKAIAWKLGISEHTVKFHVASILAKLRASSRTEAVTIGVRRGLILL